ncbi:MAG: glycosyltransferase family 4 protein [Candidatus Aenigmatarchaeota archaeon]
MKSKIAFIYHTPHHSHAGFARSINADFIYYNPYNLPTFLTPLYMIYGYEKIKKYDILFLESGSCLSLASSLKLRKKKLKIILLLMDPIVHNLLFIKRKYLIFLIKRYVNGIIAVSNYIKRLARKNGIKCPIRVAYPYAYRLYNDVKPKLENKNILFIGHARKSKGYMKLVEAFKILREKDKEWNLYLVGECSKDIKEKFDGLHVEGRVSNLKKYFNICSLYVHPADFDPCPVSVWEAMSAGLIPILTKNVGNSEVLEENGLKELILGNNDPVNISNKIEEIFYSNSKKEISSLCRKIANEFTESKRKYMFRKEFFKLLDEINEKNLQ